MMGLNTSKCSESKFYFVVCCCSLCFSASFFGCCCCIVSFCVLIPSTGFLGNFFFTLWGYLLIEWSKPYHERKKVKRIQSPLRVKEVHKELPSKILLLEIYFLGPVILQNICPRNMSDSRFHHENSCHGSKTSKPHYGNCHAMCFLGRNTMT